jgi:hypothetical protein
MALRRNSLLAAVIAAGFMSSPALAGNLDDNYIYDYMNHRDSITIGLGDATTSNIIIMHPTPWPSYINNTTINISGDQGISALESMMQQQATGGSAASSGSMGSSGSNADATSAPTAGN